MAGEHSGSMIGQLNAPVAKPKTATTPVILNPLGGPKDMSNYVTSGIVTPTPVVDPYAGLSTNEKNAKIIADYAAKHPAGPHQHYGTTLDANGVPRLYWDLGWMAGPNGEPVSSLNVTPTPDGKPTLTPDGKPTLIPDGKPKTVATTVANADGSVTVVYTDGTHDLIPSPLAKSTDTGVAQSAKDIVNKFLADAGLAALSDQAWSQWKQGTSAAQIIDSIRATPEYAKRFPAMKALAASGRAIDEKTYIDKEQTDIELMKQYGIPSGIYDTTDFLGKLIANNVTTPDLQKRLMAVQSAIDPNVAKYAQDTYGLDQGHLMAYMLNPEMALPVLQQKAQAMQIGGAAYRAGLGLGQQSAEQLAAAGIDQAQAKAGFGNIAQEQQFAQALPGDTSGSVTQQQLINAQFGLSPSDLLAVKKVQQGRVNEFGAGGGFAASQAGAGGLGVANAAS